jgi:Peptidase family M28
VGIVIFNQGETTDEARQGIPAVTLTANNTSGIPVLGTTYALGETLANTPGLRMRVFANTLRQTLPTANVIAEKTGANNNNVVMAGAHLDSVLAGPGINDNGRAAPPSLRLPSSSPTWTHRTRSASRGGAPRRAGSSARRTTSTA